MRKLWAGGPVTHEGRFWKLNGTELRPVKHPEREQSAMQPGGPRIIVCGRKEPVMRRAARQGDGFMPYLVSPNAYARGVELIRNEAREAGRDLQNFEWMLYLYCSVRRDGDRARADVARFLGSAYGDKPQAMLDRIAPSGTPEQVAEQLQPYIDAGARHIIIAPAAQEDTLEVVTLAAREVLPRLSLPKESAR